MLLFFRVLRDSSGYTVDGYVHRQALCIPGISTIVYPVRHQQQVTCIYYTWQKWRSFTIKVLLPHLLQFSKHY